MRFRQLEPENMLLRLLSVDLSRAILNKFFAISIVLALGTLLHGLATFYGPYVQPPAGLSPFVSNAFLAWRNSFGGLFPLVAPLLAALPTADLLVVDRRQGLARGILARVSHGNYLTSKIAATAIAGALALLIPLALFGVYLSANYPVGMPPLAEFGTPPDMPPGAVPGLMGGVFYWHPFVYVLGCMLLAGLVGSVYSLLGLAMSAFTDNRYVVVAAPLVFYVLEILFFGALLGSPAWSPATALNPGSVTVVSWFDVLVPLLALGTGSVLILFLFVRRDNTRLGY